MSRAFAVEQELINLDVKIADLRDFLFGEGYTSTSRADALAESGELLEVEYNLLIKQLNAMDQYSISLTRRLEILKLKEKVDAQ